MSDLFPSQLEDEIVGFDQNDEADQAVDTVSDFTTRLSNFSQAEAKTIASISVSKIILVILQYAIDGRASAIHIEPTLGETLVRFRIDGNLFTSLVLPKYLHALLVAKIKSLANIDVGQNQQPQEGRLSLNINGLPTVFLAITLPLFDGEKVVLKRLPTAANLPSFNELGFNATHLELIVQGFKRGSGLFLVAGPAAAGKTTTLYSILNFLNQEGKNIVTLEDPIECYLNGVNQSQINQGIGYTFESGLPAVLKQDPNIIMLSALTGAEVAKTITQIGTAGRLVLASVPTNTALGAVFWLRDLGVEPFLLASSLNTIIAQRLVKKLCPYCHKEYNLADDLKKEVKKQLAEIPAKYLAEVNTDTPTFFDSVGCPHCGGKGYLGQTLIAEVISFTPEIKKLIKDGAKQLDLEEELKKQNFITIAQDCLIKALSGLTSFKEFFRILQS